MLTRCLVVPFPSCRPVKRPRTIQFGVLSPEEIKAISVCKVEYPETYEEGSNRPVSWLTCPLPALACWLRGGDVEGVQLTRLSCTTETWRTLRPSFGYD